MNENYFLEFKQVMEDAGCAVEDAISNLEAAHGVDEHYPRTPENIEKYVPENVRQAISDLRKIEEQLNNIKQVFSDEIRSEQQYLDHLSDLADGRSY